MIFENMNISRLKIVIIAFTSIVIINIAIFALIRSRNNKKTSIPTTDSAQELSSGFPLDTNLNADPQNSQDSLPELAADGSDQPPAQATPQQPTYVPPPTPKIPPDQVANQFLSFIQQNQRETVKTLISPQANQQAFAPTLQGTDSPQSLYGKSFTFKVTNTFIEAPKTVSRVTVQISQNNQTSSRTLIFLNTTGNWMLVDQEVYQTLLATEDVDQPPSP